MKAKRFRGLIGVTIGFILMFAILLIERIGIMYEEANPEVMLLSDDQIVHMKDSVKQKTCLVLYESKNSTSYLALETYEQILIDMRVPYETVDISQEHSEYSQLLNNYKTVVLAMSDISSFGEDIRDVISWVGNGGRLLYGTAPFKGTAFEYIAPKMGIVSSAGEYAVVDEFESSSDFMLGAQRSYAIEDPYESCLGAVLDSSCKVYATAQNGTVPLIWSREYKKGKFVVCNFGYIDRAYRGVFSSAYTLLDDVFIYPVINASTFYLDDFPSPVPSGNGEYVKRDYNMGIADFYSRVWWPDMLQMGREHDITYTGLIIENYQDQTKGELPSNDSTANYYYYGNMLLNQGGELGYHGYNHQPLCIDGFVYNEDLGYNTWENYETMKSSVEELIRFSSSIFPTQDMSVYVPPSDVLSEEGRRMLGYEFPQVKIIASIYFEGPDEYVQEFEVADDGIVETPRIISGGIIDDYMKFAAFSELNFHFVCSHFIHPDDLLDEDRGAELGWEELKSRIDDYMTWIDESGKDIRHLNGSEMAGAVQRYVNMVPEYQVANNSVLLTNTGLIDSCYYLIRVNDGEIGDTYGGELTQLNGTLYLLKAQSKRVTLTRNK